MGRPAGSSTTARTCGSGWRSSAPWPTGLCTGKSWATVSCGDLNLSFFPLLSCILSSLCSPDAVLLRLASCDLRLDTRKLGECKISSHNQVTTCVPGALCQAQCANYLEGIGDWIRFPDTIHEGLCHLTECIGRFPKVIFLSFLPHS